MKLKIRDKDIQFIYYFFATMMVVSMVAACYKKFFQHADQFDLSVFYTFFCHDVICPILLCDSVCTRKD